MPVCNRGKRLDGIGSKFRGRSNSSNDDLDEKAWAELEAYDIQQGLWARSWAEHKGHEERTKAAYLKERASQLRDAEVDEGPSAVPPEPDGRIGAYLISHQR